MVHIQVNGAPASLTARSRHDAGWDLICSDPIVGEFRLCSGGHAALMVARKRSSASRH
jgi:hypothetical protein